MSSSQTAGSSRGHARKVTTQVNDSLYELYMPVDKTPKMQVIFFHGLPFPSTDFSNTHLSTWESADGSCIWPQTWLPEVFADAHILTVSYSEGLRMGSVENFDMFVVSENLISDLMQGNIGQTPLRPVVLVGHSFGGLVIKNLCLQAHDTLHRGKRNTAKLKNFLDNVTGIFFYSTPHRGSPHVGKAAKVLGGPLLKYFATLNNDTARLSQHFNHMLETYTQWQIEGIGESLPVQSGLFKGVIVVPEASARDGDRFNVVPADHFSISKPKARNERRFYAVTSLLQSIADNFKEEIKTGGEIRLKEESTFLILKRKMARILVSSRVQTLQRNVSQSAVSGQDAWSKGKVVTFARIWNEIITSLQREDVVSNREMEFLLMPSNVDKSTKMIQWPLCLLANKVYMAVEMTQDKKSRNQQHLWERIRKDEHMAYAVVEAYNALEVVLMSLVNDEEKTWVRSVFGDLDFSSQESMLVAHFHLRQVNLVVFRVQALSNILEYPNDDYGKRYTKTAGKDAAVKAMRDLYEAVMHDFFSYDLRVKYGSWSPLAESTDDGLLFANLNWPTSTDEKEAVQRLNHLFATKADAFKFAPLWNEMITSLRKLDFISDRENELLLMPSIVDKSTNVVQWPLFLLANKVHMAVELAQNNKYINQLRLWERIGKDEQMAYAVAEAYNAAVVVLKSLLNAEAKTWVRSVFSDIEGAIEECMFIGDFHVKQVKSIIYRVEALTGILVHPEDENRQRAAVEAMQFLYDTVMHDFLADDLREKFESWTLLVEAKNAGRLFANLNWPTSTDEKEAVKRLHLLLTIKKPSTYTAQKWRQDVVANSLFMHMPVAP